MNDICNICIFHCNALPHTKTCSFILKPRSTTRCAVWRQLTSSCHIITIQIIGLSCIIITRSKQGSAVWRRRTSTSSRRSSSSSSSVSSLASAVCAAAGPGSLFKYHTNSLLFFMNLFLEYFTKDLINCFFSSGACPTSVCLPWTEKFRKQLKKNQFVLQVPLQNLGFFVKLCPFWGSCSGVCRWLTE